VARRVRGPPPGGVRKRAAGVCRLAVPPRFGHGRPGRSGRRGEMLFDTCLELGLLCCRRKGVRYRRPCPTPQRPTCRRSGRRGLFAAGAIPFARLKSRSALLLRARLPHRGGRAGGRTPDLLVGSKPSRLLGFYSGRLAAGLGRRELVRHACSRSCSRLWQTGGAFTPIVRPHPPPEAGRSGGSRAAGLLFSCRAG